MKIFLTILKRELKSEFSSPMIYLFAAILSFIMGYLFYMLVISSQQMSESSMTTSVLRPVMGTINILMMVFVPLLTMSSFATEFKNKTIHLYSMNNISWTKLLLAKFSSRLLTVMFLILPTLIFPIQLTISGYSDWGVLLMGYLGLFLSISGYVAVGLFCSSLTTNVILAAILTIAILMSSFLLAYSAAITPNFIVGQMVSFLSTIFHFESFTIGLFRSYDIFYFVGMVTLFSYLTVRSLDMRKW